MKDTIENFCQSHGIQIIDTNKRAYKITKLNTKFFQNPSDYNEALYSPAMETETLLTVEIAASELAKLAEFESAVFNHMKTQGHYDLFLTIMEQKEKEKLLRTNYPAVQKAYEQYSLMLKMAEAGEL